MTEPLPIRDGVIPSFDVEREMVDYCQKELRLFIKGAGQPPTRIAVVTMGKGDDGQFHSRANSWDAREQTARVENCGTAAALLLKRATED